MSFFRGIFVGILVLAGACSAHRLPPGTPPPEYEAPVVAPWSPDAGAEASVAALDAGPPASGAGADLSPGAGVR